MAMQAAQQAREIIDSSLCLAGWVLRDKKRLNLHEFLGVVIRGGYEENNAFCNNINHKISKYGAEGNNYKLVGNELGRTSSQ